MSKESFPKTALAGCFRSIRPTAHHPHKAYKGKYRGEEKKALVDWGEGGIGFVLLQIDALHC